MCSKRKARWFKSLLACLLVLAMCVTGCGKKEEPTPTDEVKQTVESTELDDEEAPLGSVDVETEPEETEDEEVSEDTEEVVEEEEETGLVLEEGTTLLFEGGEANMGFSTEDVEWFLTAPDDAMFTVVYSCKDASHVDWGVAGFIAIVEGVEMKGPELYAHKEDATKKVYVTCSVKDLKECLQITEGKIVGNFMLGAWNDGVISEIYITTDGKLPKVKGAEEVEFRKKVAVDTSHLKASDMTGDYMFIYNDLVTIDFRTDKYCPGYVVGDTIAVEVKMESDASFLGCFGTCVGSDYAWHMEEYKSEVGEPITVKFEITPSIDTLQFQIWWMGGTKVGVSSVSITTVGKAAAPAPAPAPSYPSGGGTNTNPGQGNTGTTDNGVIRDYKDVLVASSATENKHLGADVAEVEAWQTALTIYSDKNAAVFDAATLNEENYFVVAYTGATAPSFLVPRGGDEFYVIDPCDTSVEGYAVYAYADMVGVLGTTLADMNLPIANTGEDTLTINSVKLVSAAETTSVATVQELDAVDYSVLIERPGKELLTVPVTCEKDEIAFTLVDPDRNSVLDMTEVNDKDFHVVVEFTSAYPPGLALSGPKNDWAKVAPCYVVPPKQDGKGGIIPGEAVFSYAEMIAAYGSLEDVSSIQIWNKTDKANLKVTEVKTLDVPVAEDTNATDDAIYRGSAEGRDWADDNYMTVGAGHFADVTFDGSKKLVITYVSTNLGIDTVFQFARGDYGSVFDGGLNRGRQANFTVEEIVLTDKYASVAEYGLIVHGVNWTITKIMLADAVAGPSDDNGNDNENTDPLSGSVVINDTAWWTQKNISKNDLLCGQSLENIAKITFSSTGNFVIGFNNLDGSGTITEYNKDPHWSQIEGASSYELDLDNINFETYNFIVALSNNEGVDYTITWNVELKEGVTPEQPGTEEPEEPQIGDGRGSVSFVADSGWTEYELTKDQLFCGVELDKIAGFRFSGETNISVGFTSFAEGGWTQYQDKTSHEVSIEEINFAGFAFKFALCNNDNQKYTINWQVVLKEEGGNEGGNEGGEEGGQEPVDPQPEVGKGTATFTATSGWTEYVMSKDALLCGVNKEEIATITFRSDVNFVIGHKNTDGSGVITEWNTDPYWSQLEGNSTYVIDMQKVEMESYWFVLVLTNNDQNDYTITWEVTLKEAGGNEGGEGNVPAGPQIEYGRGSLVYTEQTGWIKKNISKEELFCGVELDQIAGFKFSSTTNVYVGFNGSAGAWVEHKDAPVQEVAIEEIDLEGFAMELALWNETTEYTITWEVVLKEAGETEGGEGEGTETPQPTPEPQPNPTGSATITAETNGWTDLAISKEQLFCGVDPAEVAGFRFSGPCYIYVGFNGAEGGWIEHKDDFVQEVAIEEMSLDGFGMKLAATYEGTDITITWEVIKK